MPRTAVVVAGLLLVVTSCGNDGDSGGSTTGNTSPTTIDEAAGASTVSSELKTTTTESTTSTTEPPTTTTEAAIWTEEVQMIEVALDGPHAKAFDDLVDIEYTTYDVEVLIVHTPDRECRWRNEFQRYDADLVRVAADPNRAILAVVESIDGSTVRMSIGDIRGEVSSLFDDDCAELGVFGPGSPAPEWSSGQGPG